MDMQLICQFNKGFGFSLCVIHFFSKYARAVPLKCNKDITFTNVFQKILDLCNCKPSKIWMDKCSKFYDKLMKSWLCKMDPTHIEEISAIAERFIRTLIKNKTYNTGL